MELGLALYLLAVALFVGAASHAVFVRISARRAERASNGAHRPRVREYQVKAFIETPTDVYGHQGKTRTRVIVHNRKYDHGYPTLHKTDFEVIGDSNPSDRERISELMAKAEARRDQLEDALGYAQDAARALNMQP